MAKKRRGSQAAQMMLGSFAAVGAEFPDRFVVLEWTEEAWQTSGPAEAFRVLYDELFPAVR